MNKKLHWKLFQCPAFFILSLVICLAVMFGGCAKDKSAFLEKMKEAKPIIPVKDYEKLLMGDLSAEYVGNANCQKKCHVHKKIFMDFRASTMGDQLKQSSGGMKIVDCESCHGPGGLVLEEIEEEGFTVEKNREQIKALMKGTFSKWKTYPAGAQSLICLKCHTQNATFNIHNWNGGVHAMYDVTCSDCHPVHMGADLITAPRAIMEMCLRCHKEVKSEFYLPSRHPLKEQRMFCNDCHDPHGTANPTLLRRTTVKETCGRCHGEKVGPYTFEHADLTEDCTNCHENHGSIFNKILIARPAMLCSRCHSGHLTDKKVQKIAVWSGCTNCHQWHHGTDIPTPAIIPSVRTN